MNKVFDFKYNSRYVDYVYILKLQLVDRKNKESGKCRLKKRPFEKPLKSRVQCLEVKKMFPNQPNVCTVYTMKKVSKFVPLPYEHLIRQDPRRRPATQTSLPRAPTIGLNL